MSNVSGMVRILSVDDHSLLSKGIAAVINAEPDMKLVAETSNGEEVIEKFRTHRPDVTLMDLQMPALNGIEAMIRILAEFPDARIIVLTTLIPSCAAGRPSEAMHASHTAPSSTSGGRLVLTRRLVLAIAHLSNLAIRVASASTNESSSASGRARLMYP